MMKQSEKGFLSLWDLSVDFNKLLNMAENLERNVDYVSYC